MHSLRSGNGRPPPPPPPRTAPLPPGPPVHFTYCLLGSLYTTMGGSPFCTLTIGSGLELTFTGDDSLMVAASNCAGTAAAEDNGCTAVPLPVSCFGWGFFCLRNSCFQSKRKIDKNNHWVKCLEIEGKMQLLFLDDNLICLLFNYIHLFTLKITETEVGIYERKQESKKTRKHDLDQESNKEKKEKLSLLIDRLLWRGFFLSFFYFLVFF